MHTIKCCLEARSGQQKLVAERKGPQFGVSASLPGGSIDDVSVEFRWRDITAIRLDREPVWESWIEECPDFCRMNILASSGRVRCLRTNLRAA